MKKGLEGVEVEEARERERESFAGGGLTADAQAERAQTLLAGLRTLRLPVRPSLPFPGGHLPHDVQHAGDPVHPSRTNVPRSRLAVSHQPPARECLRSLVFAERVFFLALLQRAERCEGKGGHK